MAHLPSITSPEDLKQLSPSRLKELAEEIRSRIIEVMSANGGHLASNLGSVELTLALHTVFDSPTDKFIWDVSHQTYTHKLITGRGDRFHTIRQSNGLCGFSHPEESPHDHFHAGHAGTALSLALGCLTTRDLTYGEEYIIPIIGDATLTCGMSLEAMNNMTRDMRKFIVILNDNRMSISQNVGAITRILSRMLNSPTVSRIHQELDHLAAKIPSIGSVLRKHGHKAAESLKNLFSPAAFFEQFGLSYIGPVDGHNIQEMIDVLKRVRHSQWPVIIHCHTNKGHGMEVAAKNPITWHGAKPFCTETRKFHPAKKTNPTFPKIFGDQILKMAAKDSSLIAVSPAMTSGSCLDSMRALYPERCVDVGIAEAHCLTYCGGLAHGGKSKVFCSIYATFLQRALDNLFHDICLQQLPVVLAVDRAALAGADGATHNGIYDISFLNAMPNMIIAQPRDGKILRELMLAAHSWGKPAAIRYPNLPTEDSQEDLQIRNPGFGEVLVKGDDLLIIALGHKCTTALEVRERLLEKGISVCVVDPIFVKPLDTKLLSHLLSTHTKVVTLEEHSTAAGMGTIINSFLLREGYRCDVLNIGISETFPEQGSHAELSRLLGLDADSVLDRIEKSFTFNKLKISPQKYQNTCIS